MSKIKLQKANKKYHVKRTNRGIALLVSIIVASIVLIIGLGILNIATKEIVLSMFGKESGKAFYAADTGIECAMYWDIKAPLGQYSFATSSNSEPSKSETEVLSCAGQIFNPHSHPDFDGWDFIKGPTSATTTLKFSAWTEEAVIGDGYDALSVNNPCVEVTIEKYQEDIGGGLFVVRTKINSIGYNNCDINKKYRSSRGIRVQY
ncbi:pilus assembly PilX N-terminal domain-containing protein [Patescibacteria group bacterium]|nr:pilus assembly PilX N-terminal domain-containing protein [Patescibacteria group bacterium]MBU1246729.1 pilus assembly PilX N-terminal domain-containing protein [Patescibacteria group bacterium]MBU1519423.1 pilus assembly PilX N-terminal domain-containing protein [Patescibacteria group bacterium]MBU1956524.1 pilus assembly PilX N-terminal domain-containing protein [Patescibacteria group bacterium]MBU2416400.1 pilus assembly PilX N-terminal domain-containing protein [Patescibacteria group bact